SAPLRIQWICRPAGRATLKPGDDELVEARCPLAAVEPEVMPSVWERHDRVVVVACRGQRRLDGSDALRHGHLDVVGAEDGQQRAGEAGQRGGIGTLACPAQMTKSISSAGSRTENRTGKCGTSCHLVSLLPGLPAREPRWVSVKVSRRCPDEARTGAMGAC